MGLEGEGRVCQQFCLWLTAVDFRHLLPFDTAAYKVGKKRSSGMSAAV